MKTGIELIAEERQRQITVKGWTSEHDAEHDEQELSRAAACYAMPAELRHMYVKTPVPTDWPFPFSSWKPAPNDRIKELAKAGALIAAEIDRINNLNK